MGVIRVKSTADGKNPILVAPVKIWPPNISKETGRMLMSHFDANTNSFAPVNRMPVKPISRKTPIRIRERLTSNTHVRRRNKVSNAGAGRETPHSTEPKVVQEDA